MFSALEGIEVNQSVAMTGSLSVRGKVLPVGGVTAKIEAAAEMGLKKVIIPKSNLKDVILEDRYTNMIEIIPVENISEVLEHALIIGPEKDGLLKRLTSVIVPKRVTGTANLDSTPA